METVSADEAIAALRRGQPLSDVAVAGTLGLEVLAEDGVVRIPIRIARCRLAAVVGVFLRFDAPVAIASSTLGALTFTSASFPGGLDLEGCIVDGAVDLQCGGHNARDRSFQLSRCVFRDFVNFFDCWFEGPVIVRGCSFERGTNLLGNVGGPAAVQFDVPPVLESNVGALDRD